jgi:hypothetical protein
VAVPPQRIKQPVQSGLKRTIRVQHGQVEINSDTARALWKGMEKVGGDECHTSRLCDSREGIVPVSMPA